MPPYNLRPHPKPANPTDDTRKRVKQSKQSKRQKDMQAINMERGLLSLRETTPRLESATYFDSTGSPLLRLPDEIRTKIYEYVLVGKKAALVDWNYDSERFGTVGVQQCPCLKHGGSCRFSYATHLSFIRVCRQIYNEASMIHCARNNFHVCVSLGCDVVGVLADSLRKGQLQALRHLEFPASEVVSELCWRQHLHKNWNDRLFDDMSLTELFPNLKSVTVEDFDTEYHRNRGQRVLRRSAPSSSVYPDVREMLLGGCKDGVELVLPEWMSRYLGSA
ncbi:uncharacterized protein CC84DRAFT_1215199 [Paraphaeosphaeria sporulosa]|uniref:DUF7730 domain-containing protein n=1 Tax=Paraphaeosphaeria sporulosa TaxID=1460663 RepID=A0A177CMI5_9PLEO|nr:uncharacterized protein CC84DRAFT_1215199 [Paraphaeosphaeria sporulosa]OAG08723.1 hypothetical protein CC84DRAFT_1215199 [Paraphaeosphaeria sporulosa]